jgi:hypothetical protein
MELMSLSFKFACEISNDKFEIQYLRIQVWNLIEHLSIPKCTNISLRSYAFCCGIPTVLQSDQATRPPHSGVSKMVPAFELSSSVCPTKKSSLLIPKHSHWPKREIFHPQ